MQKATALLVSFVLGCVDVTTPPAPVAEPALDFRGAALSGDFGPRTGFDGVASVESFPDAEVLKLYVQRNEGERGVAMAIVAIDKSKFDAVDPAAIEVTVCSGPDVDTVDYDRKAEVVEYENDPGVGLIVFARGANGDDVTVDFDVAQK